MLLAAPGLTTRSKDATSNKGHRYERSKDATNFNSNSFLLLLARHLLLLVRHLLLLAMHLFLIASCYY